MKTGSLNVNYKKTNHVNCNNMKPKNLIILTVSLVLGSAVLAQDGKKDKNKSADATVAAPVVNTTPGEPSQQCLQNISLFNESAKNKQYADALAPWTAAYTECPGANKVIYSRGREIVQWELTQAKDPATYKLIFDKLMGLYDNRIKYFGTDEKYPTPWILGLKGLDYVAYVKNDDLKKTAYEWLEKSIDGMSENVEMEVVRVFMQLSGALYKANPAHAEKFIADYLKVNAILGTISANPNHKNSQTAAGLKANLDNTFAQSGAADCNTLDGLYKDKIAQKSTDLDYLNSVIGFYKRVRCTESEVYFAASLAVHKIQPSAESANGCAEMSFKKKEYSKAIGFYEEATRLATDKMDKADYQYKIAQLYSNLDNYSKAREAARNSLEFNPNNGKPYILIGKLYAGSNVFDDPVLKKTVYWVAVDKFQKARQVDPSCADEAADLIRRYSPHFPSKDDIFFKPELQEGKSFFVGGWISESTICR